MRKLPNAAFKLWPADANFSRDPLAFCNYTLDSVFVGAPVPVPAFDARGFLPPFMGLDGTTRDRSPYRATMTEIVMTLGTTPERRELLEGLIGYRSMLTRLGYTDGLQFIDGTFAENIELRESRAPRDIDVFSFLVRPLKYQQDAALWGSAGFSEWLNEIVNRNLNITRYKIDAYAMAVDQSGPLDVIVETVYWYSLFAHKRITRDWKGFVQVALNPADDTAAMLLL